MTRQQKLVPIGVLVIMVLALGWAMVPFNFANVVDCEAPLFGAEPKNEAPPTSFINAEEDCLSKGKSRLLVSATASLFAAEIAQPDSRRYLVALGEQGAGWSLWPNWIST